MIDRKTIENLIKLMIEHDVVELDVADGEQSITLRRGGAYAPGPMQAAPSPAVPAVPQPLNPSAEPVAGAVSAGDTTEIKSPMVGTFYCRPNPDSDPFISAGMKISETTVVCLIEAMKVFNEIKAECRGTITEILVSDGDAVEFGQPLFRVKPN